jgi:hypothetical protein
VYLTAPRDWSSRAPYLCSIARVSVTKFV